MARVFHVKRFSPGPAQRIGHGMWRLRTGLLLVVLMAGCVASRDINPITGHTRFYGYTWEQELQIGRESDPQIVAQYGVYDNPELAQYVVRVGETVLQHSHLRRPGADPRFRNLTFTFRVLDSPVVNAFALPGGYVYVTRGLLAHLENEAQLAVVLGHEIGHVAGRHASKRAASQSFFQLGLLGGALLGQGLLGGNAAENILNVGGSATQLLFLSYGRDDERESDDVGVEYAAKAGYRAGEGAAFFGTLRRLSAQSNQNLPSFLSTHPDPGEREQTIRLHAAKWAAQTTMTRVEQAAYLEQIDGIVLGDNPRQGLTRNGTFYHPDLRFLFPVPPGFQVINQPTQVAMVEEKQQALIFFSIEQDARTADEAAASFSGRKGLTVVQNIPSRSGPLPARAIVADARTEQGQAVRLIGYFVEYEGSVYAFLGYTTAAAFETYEATFYRTMRGFAALTDPDILSIQPTRLRVVPASNDAPFRTFVSRQPPEGWDIERMAILNQVQQDQPITRGTPLKLIQ